MGLKECLVLVLASGCALAANYTIDDCPASIPHDRHLQVFGDTCYSFMTSHRREFDAAERECESNLGHLVIIRDAATQDFLYNALRHDLRYNGVVWIGLSDKVNEGQFVWVDGSPAHYTHWASGQPGILGGLEDCVGMNIKQQGQWNDYQCEGFLFISNSHVFVCEYPLGPTTAPPTTIPTTAPTPTNAAVTGGSSSPMTAAATSASSAGSTVPTQQTTTPQAMTSDTTQQTTTAATQATTGACPPFSCSRDCGLSGYKTDDDGCLVCECDTSM
ncbi:alpha-N-acetylgalactosamine-specific lectin-like isoform X2 [Littorina saxatilis]|uniref:C-type lectin domain-containing protein n=1 Tax=Littorina saxatilis TaxID=31220 RepID=A0AAN9AVC1_9CAEN